MFPRLTSIRLEYGDEEALARNPCMTNIFDSDEIVALTLIHFMFCNFCNQCSLFSLSKKKKKFKKLCPGLLKLVNLKPTLLGIGSFYKNLFCLRLKHYRVFKFVQRCWILDYGHQVIIVSCKWQGIITFPAWDQRIGDTYSSDQGCGNSYMLRARGNLD